MISTKVMPTAVTATAGMSLAIVTKVSAEKKYSLCQLKKPTISASAASRPATVPIALVIAARVVMGFEVLMRSVLGSCSCRRRRRR